MSHIKMRYSEKYKDEIEKFKNGDLQTPVSKTFCILPWIHLSTRPNGELRICCNANSSVSKKDENEYLTINGGVGLIRDQAGIPANLSSSSMNEAWNNDFMKKTRKAMINGEIPRSCTKCFEEEQNKIISKRLWETYLWKESIDYNELIENTNEDGSIPLNIKYFDLRLGNLCNLQCAMCSPHDSSSWQKNWKNIKLNTKSEFVKSYINSVFDEDETYKKTDWYKSPEFINDFYNQLPNVHQLYFAGGEPFLIKEHYNILEKCIELGCAKNIVLRYNTNLTTLPEKIFNLWEYFKSVKVICSVDGFDKVNHYVRYPTNWIDIERNLRKLDNSPDNITISLACCVNILNVFNFDNFVKWKILQNYKKINYTTDESGLINWHLVYTPSILNIRCLPNDKKEIIKFKIENLITWIRDNYIDNGDPWGILRLDGLISYMYEEDWSSKLYDTQQFIIGMDNARLINIEDYIPDAAFLKSDKYLINGDIPTT